LMVRRWISARFSHTGFGIEPLAVATSEPTAMPSPFNTHGSRAPHPTYGIADMDNPAGTLVHLGDTGYGDELHTMAPTSTEGTSG
jgi:hypothetical protein